MFLNTRNSSYMGSQHLGLRCGIVVNTVDIAGLDENLGD